MEIDHAVTLQRHRTADDVGDGDHLGLALPRLADRRQRVGGFTRLRDADHQGVLVDDRLAIAEFRGGFDLDRKARQVLDDVFAQKGRVVRGAGRHHLDVFDLEQLAIGQAEFLERDFAFIAQAAAQGVGDSLRGFVDLLGHEVWIAALLGLADVPLDLDDFWLDGGAADGAHLGPKLGDRHHLAFAEEQDFLGVRDDGSDVRGDEPFLVADADHEGGVEPGADQQVRVALREDRHGVGTLEARQRDADRGHQVALVVFFDQVRNDFGIGLRDKDMAAGLQLFAQLGEVFDDPVVDHHDPLVAVGGGMGIDHRRATVGSPPGVADAEPALGHLLGQPLDQGVDLGGALHDRGLAVRLVEDGDAGGIIATVLEPLEALHDDGGRRALAQVADDSTHAAASYVPRLGANKRTKSVRSFGETRGSAQGYGAGDGETPGVAEMKTWTVAVF